MKVCVYNKDSRKLLLKANILEIFAARELRICCFYLGVDIWCYIGPADD